MDRDLTNFKYFVDVILHQDWKNELEELKNYAKIGYWKELFDVLDNMLIPDKIQVEFTLFKLTFLLQREHFT